MKIKTCVVSLSLFLLGCNDHEFYKPDVVSDYTKTGQRLRGFSEHWGGQQIQPTPDGTYKNLEYVSIDGKKVLERRIYTFIDGKVDAEVTLTTHIFWAFPSRKQVLRARASYEFFDGFIQYHHVSGARVIFPDNAVPYEYISSKDGNFLITYQQSGELVVAKKFTQIATISD